MLFKSLGKQLQQSNTKYCTLTLHNSKMVQARTITRDQASVLQMQIVYTPLFPKVNKPEYYVDCWPSAVTICGHPPKTVQPQY